MIPVEEAIRIMHRDRDDAVAVFSYTGGRLWRAISEHSELDLPMGTSMGKVCDVALGIALARPDRKVLAIDGDGALLMNLGGLVTVSHMAPANLCYVLLQDDIYLTTGGQPVPGAGKVDFAAIARGAGFQQSYAFADVEEFAGEFAALFQRPGPTFVSLRVANPPELPNLGPARRFGEAARDVAEALRGASSSA
jgi:phosphonopyruvate decarboxylase